MLRRRLKIKRFFLKASKAWTWLLIGMFFRLNILLLIKLSRIQIENRTWKSKVNLSLAAQISLMEHNLEGEYMGSDIELLLKQEELGPGLAEDVPGLSVIYIMGMTCDNCLRMEIDIFRTKVAELKALNVTPIMVFGNIEKTHYTRLIKSLGLEDISTRDEGSILIKRFAKITVPMVLLINSNKRVLVANISDYRDRDKSIRFYEKVFAIASHI